MLPESIQFPLNAPDHDAPNNADTPPYCSTLPRPMTQGVISVESKRNPWGLTNSLRHGYHRLHDTDTGLVYVLRDRNHQPWIPGKLVRDYRTISVITDVSDDPRAHGELI